MFSAYKHTAISLLGTANGENDYEAEAGEFDPIKHHNSYCPWVNGNVAAAGCESDSGSSSSSTVALCGLQLTLDALDTFQSVGHVLNQTMRPSLQLLCIRSSAGRRSWRCDLR